MSDEPKKDDVTVIIEGLVADVLISACEALEKITRIIRESAGKDKA